MAYFNDSRCTAGGVCLTDPLLFTCELNDVALLRVIVPAGGQEIISKGDNATMANLPAGFTAKSVIITEIDNFTRNISVTLFVANASLLDDGEIICDNTSRIRVMAGCLLHSKL